MSGTRLAETIDALVALWSGVGISTVDGWVVSGDTGTRLFVGYDGDQEGEWQAAELDSEWAGLGAKKRDESFDIICSVVTRSGFRTPKEARDEALTVFHMASNALRANPSLGFTPPFVAAPVPQGLFTPPGSSGVQGRLVFNVHIETRV